MYASNWSQTVKKLHLGNDDSSSCCGTLTSAIVILVLSPSFDERLHKRWQYCVAIVVSSNWPPWMTTHTGVRHVPIGGAVLVIRIKPVRSTTRTAVMVIRTNSYLALVKSAPQIVYCSESVHLA